MHSGVALAARDTCFENVEALDCELARLAQRSGSLRLAMGIGLDALARSGGYAALGFPSLNAYALERCERSASWTRSTRRLSSRVIGLPRLRGALISGRVSWSMAAEIARVAVPSDEAEWLRISGQCTVKRFREVVRTLREAPASDDQQDEAPEDDCTLTVTAEREEAWLRECARIIHRHLDGGTTSDFVEALVFEGVSTLRELLPKDAVDSEELVPDNAAQNAWNKQLARYRDQAEELVDASVLSRRTDGLPSELRVEEGDFEGPPQSIDLRLRQISGQLAERELRIGELAERFWKADGWRRLRYASASQYTRERLGMSLTCIKDRRQLAHQLSRLPVLKETFLNGYICYEALRLTAAIATRQTDAAWALRATERTLVHLHEDIRAAELLARVGRRESIEPPTEEVVTELRSLETAVVTGAVFRDENAPGLGRKSAASVDTLRDSLCAGARVTCTAPPRDAESARADVTALWTAFAEARRAPSQLRSLAHDVQRFRVRPDVRDLYRSVERQYLRYRPLPLSFFRFLCLNFIETWVRELPPVAYADIYARDGLRCTNPVCTNRDCQPHHVKFRSQGGGDEPTNLTTLCTQCHLRGVHQGHIAVRGSAPHGLLWRIGTHTVVEGRRRQRMVAQLLTSNPSAVTTTR
jgi:5-methylcytosine-specific restriction endonuclease McrA